MSYNGAAKYKDIRFLKSSFSHYGLGDFADFTDFTDVCLHLKNGSNKYAQLSNFSLATASASLQCGTIIWKLWRQIIACNLIICHIRRESCYLSCNPSKPGERGGD